MNNENTTVDELDDETLALLAAFISDTTPEEVILGMDTGFVYWNVAGMLDPSVKELHAKVHEHLATERNYTTSASFDNDEWEMVEDTLPYKGGAPGFESLPMELINASTSTGVQVVVVTDGRGEPFTVEYPARWTWVLTADGVDTMSALNPGMRVLRLS